MKDTKHYLMIKTHKQTDLKYLCKTSTNREQHCFTYKGSGVFWKRHLSKYGNDITTEIIEKCDTIEELSQKALYWSKFYDIVESLKWANLIVENGSNYNDRSYESMVKNRQTSWKKFLNDPILSAEYRTNRKILGKKMRKQQTGVAMEDRMGNNWQDPRAGKSWKDIYKPGFKHAQLKPYKIILNEGEQFWVFESESEICSIGLYPTPTLNNLKKYGCVYIKNITPRTKHKFKKGDKLSFEWVDPKTLSDKIYMGGNKHSHYPPNPKRLPKRSEISVTK